MNFLFTNYYYPLETKMTLSSVKKFYLDNPRTEEEINFVKEKIKDFHINRSGFRFPPRANKKYISITSMLRDIYNHYKTDIYLKEQFEKHFSPTSNDKVYEFMARIIIIARFDDEGESEKIQETFAEIEESGLKSFVLLEDENPIERNSRELHEFSYLISLAIHTEENEYNGNGFINPREELFDIKSTRFIKNLMMMEFSCKRSKKDKSDWEIFPFTKKTLLEKTSLIDKFITKMVMKNLNMLAIY